MTNAFSNVGQKTLQAPLVTVGLLIEVAMQEYGLYFGTEDFYNLIRSVGGQWNDTKERPLVCMMRSLAYAGLYWAVPVGNWAHRDEKAKKRIERFMSCPRDDLRSCYYHVGNTDVKSIFFISDTVPIVDGYVEREYLGRHTGKAYVIQNKALIQAISDKLRRILSFENSRPNYFRQHITDVRNRLMGDVCLS